MDCLAHKPAAMPAAEWTVRCELAVLYRLVAHFRWSDLIYTHISARLPGPDHHFLINDYRRMFHEMRASDLVKIDLEGERVDAAEDGKVVNRAGFVIHSALHAARADLRCIVHTHTRAGIAVSAQKEGLLPISQHALKFYGHIAYHAYEGIALDLDERERLVASLGEHRVMILRNHGLLAAGRSIAEAFLNIYFLERACQAQVKALAGGRPIVYPPEAVRLRTAGQFDREEDHMHTQLAWRSALRLLD